MSFQRFVKIHVVGFEEDMEIRLIKTIIPEMFQEAIEAYQEGIKYIHDFLVIKLLLHCY